MENQCGAGQNAVIPLADSLHTWLVVRLAGTPPLYETCFYRGRDKWFALKSFYDCRNEMKSKFFHILRSLEPCSETDIRAASIINDKKERTIKSQINRREKA